MNSMRGFTGKFFLKVMNGKEMIDRYCHNFKTIVSVDRHDLYAYIQNITMMVNIVIIEYTVGLHIITKITETPLPVHVNKVMSFVERKDMRGHPFIKC